MLPIKIQLLHPNATLPSKAHPSDACFDVVAVSITREVDYIEYGLGFATEIPEGWQGLVYPRSSISKYNLALANGVAVIDADYRGEWKVRFRQTLKEDRQYMDEGAYYSTIKPGNTIYKVGDKVAQIQFQRVPEVAFERVGSLPDSTRGTGGFGSTGA
ncbi:dUTP diphosphatase [Hymenobacter tenuis]